MKKVIVAAVAALAVMAYASEPVRAENGVSFIVGGPVGVVWHAQVVNRCKNRQLTAAEAKRTLVFPIYSVLRAYRDCNDKKKK